MPLVYWPGMFKVMYDSVDLGATQNGVEIRETVLWAPINVDHQGGTDIDAIYAGKRVTISTVAMQYLKTTIEEVFVVDTTHTRGLVGPIGGLASALARKLVLNEIDPDDRGNKTGGVKFTATSAVIDNDIGLLLSGTAPSRITLTFKIFPASTNNQTFYAQGTN